MLVFSFLGGSENCSGMAHFHNVENASVGIGGCSMVLLQLYTYGRVLLHKGVWEMDIKRIFAVMLYCYIAWLR